MLKPPILDQIVTWHLDVRDLQMVAGSLWNGKHCTFSYPENLIFEMNGLPNRGCIVYIQGQKGEVEAEIVEVGRDPTTRQFLFTIGKRKLTAYSQVRLDMEKTPDNEINTQVRIPEDHFEDESTDTFTSLEDDLK